MDPNHQGQVFPVARREIDVQPVLGKGISRITDITMQYGTGRKQFQDGIGCLRVRPVHGYGGNDGSQDHDSTNRMHVGYYL
jgi:hypothetical protein